MVKINKKMEKNQTKITVIKGGKGTYIFPVKLFMIKTAKDK